MSDSAPQPGPASALPPGEATVLLRAAAQGDSKGASRIFELLYAELREQARRNMQPERASHTLQPTALVHEVWLKVFQPERAGFEDRQHFLAVSARVMRQVLVDHARGRLRLKRGGDLQRIALDAADPSVQGMDSTTTEGLIALDAALAKLSETAPRAARVVELRYFAGLSPAAAAEVLQLSESTLAREWRYARAWLANELGEI